ncbi:ferritin-3, chloroplastic [Tanacetum coccineum]
MYQYMQDDGRDSITGFKGLSYCPGIAATHTAQGHLQCTYGRRAIVFRHEQYRERSSTNQLPKHRKILDRLCYRRMGTHRSLHQVVSCLDEAMRVREEMNDNGLKARIAKEVEANQKRIKKELEKQHVLKRKVFIFPLDSCWNNDVQLADFVESEFLGEQVEAINNLSEYVAQLRRIGKGHAYTISTKPLGMNVQTPSAKAVSTYGFMYVRKPRSFFFQNQDPQSGGRSVGDTIYKYMPCACRFSPEYVHDCLSISFKDKELAITDRVAASIRFMQSVDTGPKDVTKMREALLNDEMKLHESLHGPSLTGSDWASSISIFFCLGTQGPAKMWTWWGKMCFQEVTTKEINAVETYCKSLRGYTLVQINNAGLSQNVGSYNFVETFEKVIKTNYYGTKNVTKAVIPLMTPSSCRHIRANVERIVSSMEMEFAHTLRQSKVKIKICQASYGGFVRKSVASMLGGKKPVTTAPAFKKVGPVKTTAGKKAAGPSQNKQVALEYVEVS